MNRKQRRSAQPKYEVPTEPPPGEARDERIAYGAGCTWWGTIYQVKVVQLGGHPMPCCPYCSGMLYQKPSMEAWNEGVEAYAAAHNDPHYPAFIRWTQNRQCLSLHIQRGGETAFQRLRAQFDAERASKSN